MAHDDLRAALERISPLTDTTWRAIAAHVTERAIVAGEHLLRSGVRARDVFFVRRGLLREYYLDHAGRESIRRFCKAGEFSGSLADLLSQDGAAVSIEVLEPGAICRFAWARLDSDAEHRPDLMRLLRRAAEGLYLRKAAREFEMLTLPAAERYRRFTVDDPDLNARLPRHMIASYLGITPVHLSRISGGRSRRSSPATQRRMRSAQ